MNPNLLRDLIANSDELVEKYRDDLYNNKECGAIKRALDSVGDIRAVNSIIRKARRALTAIENPQNPEPRFDDITGYTI